METNKILSFILIYLSFCFCIQWNQEQETIIECDVIIAGGSTAAIAAALSSASEGVKTCLIEPTDWIGGQMTASGVSAIDFAWHTLVYNNFTLPVGKIDQQQDNQTPNFWKLLHQITTKGRCWVSIICFPPDKMVELLTEMSESFSNLQIFLNTVVKKVDISQSDNRTIEALYAISRQPRSGVQCGGYDIRTSQDIEDWYSPNPSNRYNKQILKFIGASNFPPIFMDATDWGELLALSNASFLQGVDERYDGDISGIGNSECGQSIAVDFIEIYNSVNTSEPPNPYHVDHPDHYGLHNFTWDKIWTYRRVLSSDWDPKPGDECLQNWDTGNDYPYGYIFLSKNETLDSVASGNWTGGINLTTLDGAERNAYGWHYWFKEHAKDPILGKITMNKTALGTCHGLVKMPYIRDSRRSIGLGDFVMTIDTISGDATNMVGYIFPDRIAIGAYDVDIHPVGCQFPSYMYNYYPILPFYIPMRALTNRQYGNLLVAGKTIAQSFLVNAATRLHPVEWSSGTGAGVVAAFMVNNQISDTGIAFKYISEIQERVKLYTPIQWTINGTQYPPY